jgi:copper transport protein
MAIWLGGLVMLSVFLLRQANEKELDSILPVWSNWATLAVTVLVLAGTAQALIEVATLNALLHTTYGKLLLLKIGLLAVVLAVAAVSRQVVHRRGAGAAEPAGVPRLRRAVLVEVAGAVLILGLTSVLVQTAPARTAAATPGPAPDRGIFSTTLDSKLYQLQLDIEPTKVGNSDVHLYAFTREGATLTVKEWKVTAALPAQGIEPIDVPVLRITDSHASGTVTLPSVGAWQFSFTLRVTDFDEATVTTVVNVS